MATPTIPTPERILEVLAQVAETQEVFSTPDLPLYDLQVLDSMKTVELIVALSTEIGVEISPAEFERDDWATPAKLVADIQRRAAV
jgi:D-alanine--poly(phosphoribitol) ligase subunit 2